MGQNVKNSHIKYKSQSDTTMSSKSIIQVRFLNLSNYSPGLLRRVISRPHLHTLHVLSRCVINTRTRLAKFLPYYAHLEIELFVRTILFLIPQ